MLAQYVFKRGGVAKVGAIDTVPQEWESPLAVLNMFISMNVMFLS